MDFQEITFHFFGSGDSVDTDVVFFVDQLGSVEENFQLAKQLGRKAYELDLTPEDLQAVQEYTEALKQRRTHLKQVLFILFT